MGNLLTTCKHDDAAALRFFEKAVELNPRSPEALSNCGTLLFKSGERMKELGYLRKAIEICPTHARGYFMLAQCYAAMEDWRSAYLTAADAFENALMYFCLAGIGTVAAIAFVRVTLPEVAAKARSAARKARKAGPAALIPIVCVAGLILYGGGKNNSQTNDPPAQTQMVSQPLARDVSQLERIVAEALEAKPIQKVGVAAVQTLGEMSEPTNALMRVEKWWRRGAYNDGYVLTFDEDWCLPYGTNHLSSVEVWASGAVYASMKAETPFVELATRISVAPQDTEVLVGRTTNNTYRIEWHNGHPNRDVHETADASIELFRNGNIIVTENGVSTEIPYDIPFEHDGFGQDEDWVRANFTNAEEIISVGYPNWVDQQVGVALTNGLYKFSAEFLEDPPEPTELVVGDTSVCVTNAGVYVFVLEKGRLYDFGPRIHIDSIQYSYSDDANSFRRAARSAAMWGVNGVWSEVGGSVLLLCWTGFTSVRRLVGLAPRASRSAQGRRSRGDRPTNTDNYLATTITLPSLNVLEGDCLEMCAMLLGLACQLGTDSPKSHLGDGNVTRLLLIQRYLQDCECRFSTQQGLSQRAHTHP